MHRDIETLKEVTNQKLGDDCDSTRRKTPCCSPTATAPGWSKCRKMLADAPTTGCCSAAHLVGDEGLLSLLRQSGYTVDPVDKR